MMGTIAAMSTVAAPNLGFGELLRTWRTRQRLSQLELSLNSGVSARHVSFIETGRARPSREMVLRLADQLGVPLRERDVMLLAAGYAPVYGERGLDDSAMAPIREALQRFLAAHEPYPAVVGDRQWNIVAANDALQLLLDGVAPSLLEPPANALRVCLHPDGMAPNIANFAEWSTHILQRLRSRATASGDTALQALYEELCGFPGVAPQESYEVAVSAELFVPLRLRHARLGELDFISTVSTFVTAADITLAELSIEAFYPANADTAARLRDV
jgi:transcriptional regulator with XRE-family HTH domain